jgi:hypothetical protein
VDKHFGNPQALTVVISSYPNRSIKYRTVKTKNNKGYVLYDLKLKEISSVLNVILNGIRSSTGHLYVHVEGARGFKIYGRSWELAAMHAVKELITRKSSDGKIFSGVITAASDKDGSLFVNIGPVLGERAKRELGNLVTRKEEPVVRL